MDAPARSKIDKIYSKPTTDPTKSYEICSRLTIKIPKRLQWRRSGVFIANFAHISHLFLMSLLLTLDK